MAEDPINPNMARVPGDGLVPAAAGTGAQLHARTLEDQRRGDNVILPGCALLAAIVLVTGTLATLVTTRDEPVVAAADADLSSPVAPAPVVPAVAPAPVAGAVDGPAPVGGAATPAAIPAGAGVTTQAVAGRPGLSVYFDTGRADVAPDFVATAATLKTWIDAHPGDRLGVSGFNDPRGNAAANAELSKNRAQAVAAALVRLGVPAATIDLDKPPVTTDAGTSAEGARRVDVVVKTPA